MKLRSFFFGNYFYGICAVALAIEANLQQGFLEKSIALYIAIFCATVWFYTLAYISDSKAINLNERAIWYQNNAKNVKFSQAILLLILFGSLFFLFKETEGKLQEISFKQWILIGLFPLIGMKYYGINNTAFQKLNLRKVGWLKPFVIGFTWAGIVNVYPLLFHNITQVAQPIHLMNFVLFFKNFMFITVLCIMFDIKDYASDANLQLKTFVVKNGLRKTIFYILLPLTIAGLGSFIVWAISNHFSTMKILLNTIPFLCMLWVAYSMHKRKSILYYLILIDGLMLLKAICGSLAMIFF